ncbi:hypothetical protein [Amycolatopsis sp. WAC 04182]|uniref:hypothetical protein n=1 Tax=Amycolatopsis sp. WAC 04182 TaxID=2203198 RepID=UPI000F7B03F4|nr:hypothetical protein [Amycolatopsis sp. WAC 04182]
MSELAQLLTAIGGLVAMVLGAVGGLVTTLRTSRRERPAAAARGATRVYEQLEKAAEDGDITADEFAEAMRLLREEGEQP